MNPWIAAGAVLLLIFYIIAIYNKLIALRIGYGNAFAQVDIQLKRRYDLIPNLVETVRAYMKHERETLEGVVLARNRALSAAQTAAQNPGDPASMQRLASAEATLASGLGRLLSLTEAYPDLKASTNMSELAEELTSTENKVAFARQAYNDAVAKYNTQRSVFPSVVIANLFGFVAATLLEAIEAHDQRVAPKVAFS